MSAHVHRFHPHLNRRLAQVVNLITFIVVGEAVVL